MGEGLHMPTSCWGGHVGIVFALPVQLGSVVSCSAAARSSAIATRRRVPAAAAARRWRIGQLQARL